jgi:hypothetical protein
MDLFDRAHSSECSNGKTGNEGPVYSNVFQSIEPVKARKESDLALLDREGFKISQFLNRIEGEVHQFVFYDVDFFQGILETCEGVPG